MKDFVKPSDIEAIFERMPYIVECLVWCALSLFCVFVIIYSCKKIYFEISEIFRRTKHRNEKSIKTDEW